MNAFLKISAAVAALTVVSVSAASADDVNFDFTKVKQKAAVVNVLSNNDFGKESGAKKGGLTVNGVLQDAVIAEGNATVAVGNYADARTRIGTVENGEINGVMQRAVIAKDNANVAYGNYAYSRLHIGTARDIEVNGVVQQAVIAKRNAAVSVGNHTTTCMEIGTLGTPTC